MNAHQATLISSLARHQPKLQHHEHRDSVLHSVCLASTFPSFKLHCLVMETTGCKKLA